MGLQIGCGIDQRAIEIEHDGIKGRAHGFSQLGGFSRLGQPGAGR
jgi:hypothetical protein